MQKSNFMQDRVNNRVELLMGETKPLDDLRRFGMGGVFGGVAIVFAHALMGLL